MPCFASIFKTILQKIWLTLAIFNKKLAQLGMKYLVLQISPICKSLNIILQKIWLIILNKTLAKLGIFELFSENLFKWKSNFASFCTNFHEHNLKNFTNFYNFDQKGYRIGQILLNEAIVFKKFIKKCTILQFFKRFNTILQKIWLILPISIIKIAKLGTS